jgi:small subunit ribosomal protein S18
MNRLENKVILITGSVTGIGKAIAKRCVAEGAKVLIHGLETDLGQETLAELGADKAVLIDYKDPQALKYFISERGKVVPRRISGNCALHQRKVTLAVKRARNIALLPFTVTS